MQLGVPVVQLRRDFPGKLATQNNAEFGEHRLVDDPQQRLKLGSGQVGYLETRWASLISGISATLLEDVLPIAGTTTSETIHCHLHRIAVRQELGTGQPGFRDKGPAAGQASWIPWEAITVGIDGSYLRNWHDKQKNSRSLSASRRPRIGMIATSV